MIETKTLTYSKPAWLDEFPAYWQALRIKKLFQKMDMMNRKEEDISALTRKIIGCAMQVHRTPGNGRDYIIRILSIPKSNNHVKDKL